MSSPVIIQGDALTFSSQFGDRTVTPTGPLIIAGSGLAQITGKQMCVVGDEKKVSIAATYMSALYPTPGSGKITISQLAADQQAVCARSGAPVIIKGSQFIALFTPETPAQHPQNGPDPNKAATPGSGKFTNGQNFVIAE